ncbi:ABC transporter substrate-binding protein [Massilia sp. TWR1-2-2]|uniref:ABC transporter substrate-binding protein n=1 Tax=Massilia sp. TWR1-2-2 TaxID=2804584 RepID=UPI003CF3AE1F
MMALAGAVHAAEPAPVRVGIDAEFGLQHSTSAQAAELGVRSAIDEINASCGVLQGRKLELVVRDHRSIPARGISNIAQFAAMPDLVAVFGGRFSPVIIEELPIFKATKTLFLAPWSSADAIVDNGMHPNYVFRLSLRDSLAMPSLLGAARKRGLKKVGLLLTNTSWGRSNLAAADSFMANARDMKVVRTAWYNWRDTSLVEHYKALLAANDDEAAILVREWPRWRRPSVFPS